MQLNRASSGFSFRRKQRRNGCLSFFVLIGLMGGMGWLTRTFWMPWLMPTTPVEEAEFADATIAFQEGNLSRTIEITSYLYAQDPQDISAFVLLVRALIYHSYSDFAYEPERQQALELTSQALQSTPNQRAVYAIHAFVLQANDNRDEAIKFALRAIERDSTDVIARITLALAYSSGGLFEAGLRESIEAVRLADNFSLEWRWDAYRARAIAYGSLNRYRDALSSISTAIEFNRPLLPAHFERAFYALQLSEGDLATSVYFSILAFDNSNIKARFRLCELNISIRDNEQAIRYCTQVTERAPELSEGWYQLGREYFLQGNFRASQQAMNRCTVLQVQQNIPISERRFECWYIQGQAAEILNDCTSLLATYREFQFMANTADLPQTWTYPPEGPSICLTPTPNS
jgi:tetratricopeptide (TPR) repeat protein